MSANLRPFSVCGARADANADANANANTDANADTEPVAFCVTCPCRGRVPFCACGLGHEDPEDDAAEELEKIGISAEIIDPQTFLPFDLEKLCSQSLRKTNKLLVVGEDVPGGSSAFILQQVLEFQNGYQFLDCKPRTLTSKPNRTPYGSDGDYFTKPSADDIIEIVYEMMNDSSPTEFPQLF